MLLRLLHRVFRPKYQSTMSHHLSLPRAALQSHLLSKERESARTLARRHRQEEVEFLRILLLETLVPHHLHLGHLRLRLSRTLGLQLRHLFRQLLQGLYLLPLLV